MARRHNNVRFARGRSKKAWFGSSDVGNAIAGGGTKVLLGSISLSNTNIDETLLRTVGMISVRTDQIVASEVQQGAFGMIVVTDLAVAAGAASIPGPLTDIGDDGWFVHVPFLNRFEFVTGAGFDANTAVNKEFDFKSKRRLEEGQSMAIMVETTAGSGGINFLTIFRILSMVSGTR